MKLSDARLAELEALLASSTAGRWEAEGYEVFGVDTTLGEIVAEMGLSPIDGKFIAASHEALPALLAEVRSSRAALARIASAYRDPGIAPDWHAYVKRTVRQDWPTLTAAIEAAIR